MINWRYIVHLLGLLLVLEGAFMGLAAIVSVLTGGSDLLPILGAGLLTSGIGGAFWFLFRRVSRETGKKEGYILVSLVWVAYAFFGALPFYLGGYIPSLTDAVFETMSGLTTCGASILSDIEALPRGILFWRSLTAGIGGVGILVMVIAILPTIGAGSMMLYRAEAAEGTRMSPRIKDTAKWIISLYIGLNILSFLLYALAGMSFFDAACHALTSISTSGYSTFNDSFASLNPGIQYVGIFSMFIGSVSFVMLITFVRRQYKKLYPNDEFFLYVKVILLAALVVAVGLYWHHGYGAEDAFRVSLFHVVSIISTTGYISADYLQWGLPLYAVFFLLMFLGGCAGSTAAGIKMVRLLVLLRAVRVQFQKILHHRGMIFVKINRHNVSDTMMARTMSFLVIYLMAFALGAFGLMFTGLDFESSMGASIASLSCVGPAIGSVGPVENYGHLTDVAKYICTFLMLLGRLELYSFLILFVPDFWRKS